MCAAIKDGEIWGLKDGTWRVKGSESWMLVAGDLSCIIHFPAIIQSIISPEQTVGSSKLKVTLWWAPPSRVWCMCVCVCVSQTEGHLGGLFSRCIIHTHARVYLVLGRTKVCSWACENSNKSTGERKEVYSFFSRSHLAEEQTARCQSIQTEQQSHQVLCVCVSLCVLLLWPLSWVLVPGNLGYLGV